MQAPTTQVIFCNVPWNSDYKFVCDGADAAYIASTAVKTYYDYTYQRKDNTIKVNAPIDDLMGANYVMYKNTSHENKWFYAFIDKVTYISENTTLVSIKTDVYQTWKSEAVLKDSIKAPDRKNGTRSKR